MKDVKTGDLVAFYVPFGYPGQNGWNIGFFESFTPSEYDSPGQFRVVKNDGKIYSYYIAIVEPSLVVLSEEHDKILQLAKESNWNCISEKNRT